ncbi:hypothetical protein AVEN_5152-1 [Araneus ventricosus]|uniref:Uncharacterized protein n=1 Tax=Araneus ventricosus TaxID=182803 RepID=A0A4Y2HSC6_ARAVE|nr:hypothetical protein AVEN_5152-1 [Araneus ventricosus]
MKKLLRTPHKPLQQICKRLLESKVLYEHQKVRKHTLIPLASSLLFSGPTLKCQDSYDKAVKLEERAVFTSDLNSETEDVEELSRRKRKRPVVNRHSSSEDEIHHLPPFPQMKRHSLPEVPSLSGQTQVVLQQQPFREQIPEVVSYMPLNRQLPANSVSPKNVTPLVERPEKNQR